MATNFRNLFGFMVPSWLSNGDGGKVLYSLAILKDCYTQWARDVLEMRFPSRAGASALTLIGQDRGIPRGRTEVAAHYAKRLKAWRYPRGHRTRGSAFAVLEQVCEYFGGIYCWTITAQGTQHGRTPAGVESFAYGLAWNWDGTASPVYRFWLQLYLPLPIKPWPTVLGAWGGLCGNPAVTVGQQGVTPDDCAAIRDLFTGRTKWKPAGTMQQYAVISFNGAFPAPDGTWATNVGRGNIGSALRFWPLS